MPRFDTEAALAASHAALDFRRLDQLDDLWTAYLDGPGPVPEEHRAGLYEIVSEMLDGLGQARKHTVFLREFIQKHRREFEEAYRISLRAASSLSSNQVGEIEQIVLANNGIAALSLRELSVLEQQIDTEAEQLRAKRDEVDQNGITHGDLSKRVKCALGIALLAATLTLAVASGVVVVPAVIAAVPLGATAIVSAVGTLHGLGLLVEGIHTVTGLGKLKKRGCFES